MSILFFFLYINYCNNVVSLLIALKLFINKSSYLLYSHTLYRVFTEYSQESHLGSFS